MISVICIYNYTQFVHAKKSKGPEPHVDNRIQKYWIVSRDLYRHMTIHSRITLSFKGQISSLIFCLWTIRRVEWQDYNNRFVYLHAIHYRRLHTHGMSKMSPVLAPPSLPGFARGPAEQLICHLTQKPATLLLWFHLYFHCSCCQACILHSCFISCRR